jgi:peptide/nickel transport system substrate-binding protein
MKMVRLLILLASMLVIVAACGSDNDEPDAAGENTSQGPGTDSGTFDADDYPPDADNGGNHELIIAAPRDLAPGRQDPYFTHPTLDVWDALVVTDEDWVPQPGLATSWEVSEDLLTWTFELRDDVVFSDGSRFDADVVVANVERNIQISPASSPFYTFDTDHAYGDFDRVEAVDEFTVAFHHNTPEPSFPAMISNFYSAMYAPASFDEDGHFAEFPIASGPFMVVSHEPDQELVLEANPEYHGDGPASDRVIVRTIPDPNTRVSALRAGEIHGVLDLGAIQPAAARELVEMDEFEESTSPIPITHYIWINAQKEPWSDPRMRQAISMAMDRQQIIDDIFFGYGIPAGSMLSIVSTEWHDSSIELEEDLDAARELVAEVIGDETVEARLLVPSFQLNRYPYQAHAEYAQARLQSIGIEAEIEVLDGAVYNEATAAGEYDLSLSIRGLANSEPYLLMRDYLAEDGGANQRLNIGFQSDEVDQIFADLREEWDPEERQRLYHRLQEIVAEELPFIPLFYEVGIVVHSADVHGYQIQPTYWVSLSEAYIR